MRKFEEMSLGFGKKIRLRYQYLNWTLVSVPATETEFWSYTDVWNKFWKG